MFSSKIAIRYWKEWKPFFLASLGVLFVALFVRLYQLTLLPVFADEAIYIRWSQIMSNEPTLRFLPLSDGKQPFFMWVLMVIINQFSDPLFAGRFVSVLSGMGAVVGIGALSYILFRSKLAALVAALLWGLSPFAVFFDRLALVDSTLAFFGIWVAVFAVLTAKLLRLDLAMITGFFLGGALLTKSPAIFFLLLLPTTVLFLKHKKKRSVQLLKLFALLAVAVVIGYGIYNILRLGPNFHMISLRNADYVYPISHIFQSPLDPLKPHFHRSLEWIWLMGPASVFGLLALSITNVKKNNLAAVLFISAWLLGPIIVGAAFAKVFTARYIFYTLPFLVVLSSLAFVNRKYLKFSFLLLGLFIIQSVWFLIQVHTDIQSAPLPQSERSGYLEEWTAGDGIREVADYLKTQHSKDPNIQIVVGTEGYFGTLPDGLQMYMQDVPKVVVKGVGLHLNELPSDLVESKQSGNKTYLVINKSRLNADPQSLGLTLIAQYPKALRTPGSHDYTLYGSQEVLYFFEVTSLPDMLR